MRPSDLSAALSGLLATQRPVFVWGPPGVGKSAIIHQAAAERSLPVIDVRAVLLDPVDLRGLPTVQKLPDGSTKTVWCAPDFLPRDGAGVIFLDELPQAPAMVQGGCLQLCLDRRLGEYELPDGWTIVAAGNRQEDRAGAHRLISPLLNRFIHLDADVSNDDWQAWAVEANVAVEVRGFLNFRPHLLFHFQPKLNERAFPTPRSWQFVSEILPHTPQRLLHQVVSGTVGEGAAAEFLGFLQVYRDLPDLEAIWKTPDKVTIPQAKPAVLFAMCAALADMSRTKPDLDALGRFYLRKEMPSEFSALTLRDTFMVNSVKVNGKPTGQPKLFANSMGRWLAAHREVLLERTGS